MPVPRRVAPHPSCMIFGRQYLMNPLRLATSRPRPRPAKRRGRTPLTMAWTRLDALKPDRNALEFVPIPAFPSARLAARKYDEVPEQPVDKDLSFQSRQRDANAGVRTGAEGEGGWSVPVRVEALRVGIGIRVVMRAFDIEDQKRVLRRVAPVGRTAAFR